MAYDTEWKPKEWTVIEVNDNVEGLVTGDVLTFNGNGDGNGNDDVLKKADGTEWGVKCKYHEGSDTATVEHKNNGDKFIVMRRTVVIGMWTDSGFNEGGVSWIAEEGSGGGGGDPIPPPDRPRPRPRP